MRLKIPAIYLAYSLLIFWAGTTGHIDEFLWGFLSWAGYLPLSECLRPCQEYILHRVFNGDISEQIYGLYTPHVITFIFDVVIGTFWWIIVSEAWLFYKSRRHIAD
ncbi:MAG: hypothetical protein KGN34_13215 [Sphingomonadales bacterium]|nr:hypothetical protein [Sphingomonadales bacterium]